MSRQDSEKVLRSGLRYVWASLLAGLMATLVYTVPALHEAVRFSIVTMGLRGLASILALVSAAFWTLGLLRLWELEKSKLLLVATGISVFRNWLPLFNPTLLAVEEACLATFCQRLVGEEGSRIPGPRAWGRLRAGWALFAVLSYGLAWNVSTPSLPFVLSLLALRLADLLLLGLSLPTASGIRPATHEAAGQPGPVRVGALAVLLGLLVLVFDRTWPLYQEFLHLGDVVSDKRGALGVLFLVQLIPSLLLKLVGRTPGWILFAPFLGAALSLYSRGGDRGRVVAGAALVGFGLFGLAPLRTVELMRMQYCRAVAPEPYPANLGELLDFSKFQGLSLAVKPQSPEPLVAGSKRKLVYEVRNYAEERVAVWGPVFESKAPLTVPPTNGARQLAHTLAPGESFSGEVEVEVGAHEDSEPLSIPAILYGRAADSTGLQVRREATLATVSTPGPEPEPR